MEPEDSAKFPTFNLQIEGLFRDAEVETINTYEQNISKYREKGFSYIPIPDSDKYYDVDVGALKEMDNDQYVMSPLSVRQLFELLSDQPFLIDDRLRSIKAYQTTDEYYIDRENAPKQAEITNLSEIADDHPEVSDNLSWNTWYYFVNRADLNRREVRETLYPIIAELESEMANAIKEDVDNPEDLYPTSPDRVVGRREKDILNDVELHTAEYLNLGSMIGLLKGRPHLWERFGFETSSEVGDRLGSIQDLRNKVMHSNRTLIRSQSDVSKTLDRVDDAQEIIATARGIPHESM